MFLLLEMNLLTISLHKFICVDDTTCSVAASALPLQAPEIHCLPSGVLWKDLHELGSKLLDLLVLTTFSEKLLQNPSSALWYPARTLWQPVSHLEESFSLFVFTPCTCFTSDVPWSWSVGIVHCIPDSFSTQAYKWVLVLGAIHG